MKKTMFHFKLLFLSACCILQISIAKSQNLAWAKQVAGTDVGEGRALAVDGAGNVYSAGAMTGTSDFDPGPGTFNLTGVDDVFITKQDPNGNMLWAKHFGGPNYDYSTSITVSPQGYLYVTGVFTGTADFDPGPGVVNMTSNGNLDIFISKFDLAGNFIWAKKIGSNGTDIPYSIVSQGEDNIFLTGQFFGTVDFDPGAGVTNLVSAGSTDVFVIKTDSAGNLIWGRSMGGPAADYAHSLAIDASGNIYTTGYFSGAADFDPGTGLLQLVAAGATSDIFISKLDPSGNFIWAKQIGGPSIDKAYSIAADPNGGVYVTGSFRGTADFDPGSAAYNLTTVPLSAIDAFICKLDASGNFVWARKMGGAQDDQGNSLALDGAGNVFCIGSFGATATFDSAGTVTRTAVADADVFVTKMTPAGALKWVRTFGGIYMDFGTCIKVDNHGNIVTSGFFEGSADFDPGTASYTLNANMIDPFTHKMFCTDTSLYTYNAQLCNGTYLFNGSAYNTSGTYTFTAMNKAGCDSLVILKLTVDTLTAIATQAAATLTATNTGSVTYQWINCDNNVPVTGATAQTFTATRDGNYAVIVDNGTCADTSACLSVTSLSIPASFKDEFRIFPNPAKEAIRVFASQVTAPLSLKLFNGMGQLVGVYEMNSSELSIDVSSKQPGIYFLEVTRLGQRTMYKVTKEL